MNLIIHKHYKNIHEMQEDMDNNANNRDKTIAYITGDNDIFNVLKELIKTEYKLHKDSVFTKLSEYSTL